MKISATSSSETIEASVLRLRHFVHLQHRLARQPDVQPRHLMLGLLDQLPHSLHGPPVEVLAQRVRRHEVDAPLVEGNVHLVLFLLLPPLEQRRDTRRWRPAGAPQRIRRLCHDPHQGRQRLDQRLVLLVVLAFGRAKLGVHQVEERDQIGRLGELHQERTILRERLPQPLQFLFGQEQQRLRSHQLQVALVKHAREQIRLPIQLGPQPFHELPVLLPVFALDHDHEVVLIRELLLELQVVFVVLLLAAHEVIAAREEFQFLPRDQVACREENAPHHQGSLRIKIPEPVMVDRVGQPAQDPGG
jgi:hypothetical protein